MLTQEYASTCTLRVLDSATSQLHRWPFALLQGYYVKVIKLIHTPCACMQEAATPPDSSRRLTELRLRGSMPPEVPSQAEVSACASSHGRTSGSNTGIHNTAHSMRIYGNDSARSLKKRKTDTPAEQVQYRWGSELKDFPELKQALLGQWPPRGWKGQGSTAGQATKGQLFATSAFCRHIRWSAVVYNTGCRKPSKVMYHRHLEICCSNRIYTHVFILLLTFCKACANLLQSADVLPTHPLYPAPVPFTRKLMLSFV